LKDNVGDEAGTALRFKIMQNPEEANKDSGSIFHLRFELYMPLEHKVKIVQVTKNVVNKNNVLMILAG
jgi:hypothetical protein